MKRLFFAIPLVFTVASCGWYHQDKQSGNGGGQRDFSKATLSYSTVRDAVFIPYCTTCHSKARGDKGHVNLESYPNVFSLRAQIRAAVFSGDMPDDKTLPAAETQLLFAWIDAGAPEVSDIPVVKPTPTQPNPP